MAKKSIDLGTLRVKPRKEPGYTSREQIALDNADRVVCRVKIQGEWKEQEFFPAAGQTVRQKLAEVQAALRHTPSVRGVCVYVGGIDPRTGERMIASVPHDWIPASVKR